MKKRKLFKELEFKDAFMFAAVLEDTELCRLMLERILGFRIREVVVHTEYAIVFNPDYRGVRLDVYADDEAGTVYNVEMQTTDQGNLPQRSRLYQGQMDVALLEPGEEFTQLPNSYVIFICTFDPFGRGRYRYTCQSFCREDGELLADGTCRIFLNTQGKNAEEVPRELVDFLAYVEFASLPATGSDDFLQRLQTRIEHLKHSRRMEERYMLFGEMLSKERREGREEGRIEGREEGRAEGRNEGRSEGQTDILSLITAMTKDGRASEVSRLSEDPAFLDEMMEAYHIEA